jgi:nucleoside-diphosphate-sugar epimerase
LGLKVLILGVNGFVGSNLSERILKTTDWSVFGMDIQKDKIEDCLGNPRFNFVEGDITINREWVEYHVKKCDVVLPLVAIATPITYVQQPLKVFELDFEANLAIVRDCVKYGKRVLFPSTSEVYGMSTDTPFDEESSNFVLGPIHKQRWIYSCSKQLLDRVIYAYGSKNELSYTLFRPFNWIGPKLDNIWAAKEGSSRVLTQFVGNIVRGENISLVAGGAQRRCFLYIDDAMDALMKIIANEGGCADKRIFNIGDPRNDFSMRELAEILIDVVKDYDGYVDVKSRIKLVDVDPDGYYGKGYEDIQVRVPAIDNARKYLGWTPKTDLRTALRKTLDYYLLGRQKDTGDLTGTPV